MTDFQLFKFSIFALFTNFNTTLFTNSGSTYKTWVAPVDEKFNVLQLFNILLSPIEAKTGLTLEIEVESGKERKTNIQL